MTGRPILVAVTGKIATGKDTVGKSLMEKLGRTDFLHTAFAAALKEEVNVAIEALRHVQAVGGGKTTALEELISRFPDIPVEWLARVRDALWDELHEGKILDSYSRTVGVRKTLQWWGTDIRRAQKDSYWVDRLLDQVVPALEADTSVLVTDVRFPNEADALLDIGGFVIRLDVSREIQAARLFQRDGVELTPDKENHKSEISLDDYDKFTLRVNNDYLTIDQAVAYIIESIPALRG